MRRFSAKLLDGDVVVEKGEFLGKRNLLPVPRVERQAKQIAQVLNHGARQPGIALHLRRDGVERIKEKMRVQLHAQRVQVCFGKAALHALQAQFTGQIVLAVAESLVHTEDDPVDKPAPQKPREGGGGKKMCIRQHSGCAKAKKGTHGDDHIEVDDGEGYARGQMGEDSPRELVLFEGKARVYPQNKRRDQTPGPPLSERAKNDAPPIAGRKTRQGKEHPEGAPKQERG